MGTVATNFLPNLTGLDLGSSGQRWDAFIQTQDISGNSTVGGNQTITGNLTVSGTTTLGTLASLTVSGNATIGGTLGVTGNTTLSGSETVNNAGVFTNTQMNGSLQVKINSADPATEFHRSFPAQNATEAITAATTIPSTSSVFQENNISSYLTNSSTTTQGVALYGQAISLITASHIWGINTVSTDTSGQPLTSGFYGMETDLNVNNVTSVPVAHLIAGNWTAQPTSAYVIQVNKPGGGFNWTYGLRFETGATPAASTSAAAVWFQPVATGTNQVSQGLEFISNDPVSGTNAGNIMLSAAGNLQVQVTKAAAGMSIPPVVNYNSIATVSGGVPAEYATVDLTAQTASIAATTIYTPTATGMFRLSAYLKITTAGTSPVIGPVTITYTDGTDSVAQSVVMAFNKQDGTVGTSNNGNTTTSTLHGVLPFYAKTGVAIQYAVTVSGTVGAGQYEVHLKLEQM